MKTTRLLLCLLPASAVLLLSGCVVTKYRADTGAEFSRIAVLNRTGVGKVKFDPKTGAVEIEGYSNEQTEIAAAVASSVAKALAPVK